MNLNFDCRPIIRIVLKVRVWWTKNQDLKLSTLIVILGRLCIGLEKLPCNGPTMTWPLLINYFSLRQYLLQVVINIKGECGMFNTWWYTHLCHVTILCTSWTSPTQQIIPNIKPVKNIHPVATGVITQDQDTNLI